MKPSAHYRWPRICLAAGITALVAVLSAGCDGDGWPIQDFKESTSGDTPTDPGGGSPPPGGGGGGGGGTPARFRGTWAASFSDDQAAATLRIGQTHYAVFMNLSEENTTITGTGRMFRNYVTAPTALQEVTFRISGTRQGDNDATLTWTANTTNAFEFSPTWRLRLAGGRMVGIYEERTTGNARVRTGHATWYRTSTTASPAFAWASAYSDAIGTTGFPRRDRAAVMTLASGTDGLSGSGLLLEQRVGDILDELNFEITRGARQQSQIGFTFGALDLAASEVDWAGFFTESALLATYAQFDQTDSVVRLGHAKWHRTPNAGPDALDGMWSAAFADSSDPAATTPSDYLTIVTLDAIDGGRIAGSAAQIRTEGPDNPAFVQYSVEMGTIAGSRVHFEFTRPTGRWVWDLNLAGTVLAGTYQQFNANGNFVSRGVAEWHKRNTNVNFVGTWVASHTDTFVSGAGGSPLSQLIRVTIASQTNDGQLTGTGLFRIAGENSARTFDLTGNVTGATMTWNLAGSGLFGRTTWTLRRVDGGLVGTFLNRNSAGGLEARGHAFWYATANS